MRRREADWNISPRWHIDATRMEVFDGRKSERLSFPGLITVPRKERPCPAAGCVPASSEVLSALLTVAPDPRLVAMFSEEGRRRFRGLGCCPFSFWEPAEVTGRFPLTSFSRHLRSSFLRPSKLVVVYPASKIASCSIYSGLFPLPLILSF